ncbi:ATP/GTP-binding protein [Streptacidiphilus sp. EB103A]|uniref:GTP-binding protein n=1 Tax=Streptacidiphilus sp. EB103A TaxID=3156275 RepID=UPI003513F68E
MTESPSSSPAYLSEEARYLVKLVVVGGLGVGKTTMVTTVTELRSVTTDEVMTVASAAVDNLQFTPQKTTTTVFMDFGRLTLPPGDMVLYLFGSPGQDRFKDAWQDLSTGAHGVLVLLDVRRLDDSFAALDLVERSGLPYCVAVNQFPESPEVSEETLRDHLDLHPTTPLVLCNALDFRSSVDALIALVRHALSRSRLEAAS